MNSMSIAIKEASIAIPANKRIWMWLKDQGPHTAVEVCKALGITEASSSANLSGMQQRRMVDGVKKFQEHSKRGVTYYSAVGREFQLLPLPKPKLIPEPSKVIVEPSKPKKSTVDELMDTMSVVEAFEVYNRLSAMFNPKPPQ